MSQFPKYSGLCETCDHDATCTLRRSSQLKIIMCEEFVTQIELGQPVHFDVTRTPELAGADSLGLCANCRNKATCALPDACHGVLSCEEYALDEAGPVHPAQLNCSRSAA